MIKHQEQVDKFISDTAPYLFGLAAVPDDWINQVKMHVYPKLSDGDVANLFHITLVMFIDFFTSRIEDLIDNETKDHIENEMVESMSQMASMLSEKGKINDKKRETKIAYLLYEGLELWRKERVERETTFTEAWTDVAVRVLKEKLPAEVIRYYITSNIESLEEGNYRQRFQKILGKLEV